MREGLIKFLLLNFLSVAVLAQDSTFSGYSFRENITPNRLRTYLSVLAHDSLEGRETGYKGQKIAAKYIEQNFKEFGLEPLKGDYVQSFPIAIETPGGSKIIVKSDTLKYLNDYFYFGNFNEEVLDFEEIVFAGYGIEDEKWNDLSDLNVKGKLVVVLSGEPKDKDGKYVLTGDSDITSDWTTDRFKKTKNLAEKGAKVVLIAQDNYKGLVSMYRTFLLRKSTRLVKENKERIMPFFYINPSVLESFISPKKLEKYKAKQKYLGDFDLNLALNIKSDAEQRTGENVMGVIEGSEFPNEYVIVTSHFDHIGMDGDKIFNGADDDGSGTSTVLALAQTYGELYKIGIKPKRSILFMTVSGEEKGLLGSEYFTNDPPIDFDQMMCNLNIDMVGRVDDEHKDNPNYVYLIGSDKLSTELHNVAIEVNKENENIELDFTYNSPDDPNRYYYRSDHYNFAKNNIPVIFYFNGTHPDYHKETDTIEKIDFETMSVRAKYIFSTIWEVANRDEMFKIDVKNDFKNDR